MLVRRAPSARGWPGSTRRWSPCSPARCCPEWAGNIYCHLMSASHELGDLRRAWYWVQATTRWLETLPAAAVFTGMCRVHRAQVLQAAGEWQQSEAEAARVCADLDDIACLPAAEGHYQLGELARLRGHDAPAEASYRRAHQLGRDPQPGLRPAAPAGRADRTPPQPRCARRCSPRPAQSAGPRPAARSHRRRSPWPSGDRPPREEAVAELEAIAERYASPGFAAAARQWRGALLLAVGTPGRGTAGARRRVPGLAGPARALRLRAGPRAAGRGLPRARRRRRRRTRACRGRRGVRAARRGTGRRRRGRAARRARRCPAG